VIVGASKTFTSLSSLRSITHFPASRGTSVQNTEREYGIDVAIWANSDAA